MIHWAWLILAWVIGEIMGAATIIICMGSGDKNKKAADAGTSTAAHMGRKDYFL